MRPSTEISWKKTSSRVLRTSDWAEGSPSNRTMTLSTQKLKDSKNGQPNSWSFQLDGILQDVSQEEVYTQVCRRVVQGALDGYNGTVMCFGQTGAGKTYTMSGSTKSYKQRGIIPRALQEVFQEVEKRTEYSISVHMSYLEIYNETLVDLLSPLHGASHRSHRGKLVIDEVGREVFIRGLSLHPVHSEEVALNLLFEGEMNRIIGSHALNRNSSRSHCIFTIHIESRSRTLSAATYVTSKLNLVDLAGSERVGKTGSEGQMFKEATYINKSLSFLEQVILALADRRRDHVPFRQTKLTHVLKDSLGGNCNTVLVANIYGEAAQIEETLSALRFAHRMKGVKTDPAVNKHLDPALQIKELQKEVQMLKDELSIHNTLVNRPNITYEPLSEAQLAEINSQVQMYLDGRLKEINIISIRQVQAVFAQFKLHWIYLCHILVTAFIARPIPAAFFFFFFYVSSLMSHAIFLFIFFPFACSFFYMFCYVLSCSLRQGEGSPASRKRLESESKSKLSSIQTPDREQESQELDTMTTDTQESQLPGNEPLQYVTPPSKADAFEDFKVGQGSTINSILKENKAVLLERHGLLRQLTEEINSIKKEIDCTTATIQQQKEKRETQGTLHMSCFEPDASLLLKIKELKAQYQQRYEALRDIKAEVNYCQHLVDQCRVRLLSEFEIWYKQTFMLPEEELELTVDKTLEQVSLSYCIPHILLILGEEKII
uniref:Kinesin-like protein n=1 Tax=Mastacembelus armatus TaxID=205130 RepID=A0A7N8XZS6_9TELE